jgi:hypothetical protein
MAAMAGAQTGMSISSPSSGSALAPTRSPNSATASGNPAASSDPKATNRISAATTRPIASPTLAGGCSKLK